MEIASPAAAAPRRSSPRVIDEAALTRGLRRRTGRLLAAEWGEAWRGDAYAGTHPPEFRVLQRSRLGRLLGHVSAFRIQTEPARTLYGIGDLVVRPSARGLGIARAICALAVAECFNGRGAEIVLVDTLAARSAFLELGFRPVDGFEFHYRATTACVRHEHWMVERRDGPAFERIRLLEHGDF